jgi:plastocyanin
MRRLCLLAGLALLSPGALPAQSLMERTPNLHGTWGLQSGHAAFVFAHRFEFIEGGDELFNIPTLTLALGLPLGLTAGLEYSSNSEIVVGARGQNEAEYWLKRGVPLGSRSAVAAMVAYNGLAESVDGAVSARADLGPVGLMGELRGFSDLFATGEAGMAGAVGGIARFTPYLGVSGDVGRVLSADSFSTVWSAGLALAIPGSPHTLSLHATNGGAMTLQGASREKVSGPKDVRYGFTFTIPLGNGAQWLQIFRPAPAPAPAASGAAALVPIRMIAYVPPEIRIRAGQSVEWVNQDPTPHTVTGEGWASELMNEGARYTRRFDAPGRYPYRCLPHPQMTGVVIVE